MADAPVVSTSKFTQPFLGSTYDGGGNSIFGIPYRLAHEGITGENQGRNGLFLDVGGESLIKNVNIVLDPTDEGSEYVFVSPMEANFDSDSSSGRLTETEPIFKTARSALPARRRLRLGSSKRVQVARRISAVWWAMQVKPM